MKKEVAFKNYFFLKKKKKKLLLKNVSDLEESVKKLGNEKEELELTNKTFKDIVEEEEKLFVDLSIRLRESEKFNLK